MNANRWMQLTQEPILRVLGPLFLVGAIGIATIGGSLDRSLIAMSAVGLFLCAKWELRGFGYALAILIIGACVGHLGETNHHWLRLGFEGAIGASLLLTALSFEEGTRNSHAMAEQMEAGKQTVRNLEEDLSKKQEELSREMVAASDRYTALQKQLEEIQAEASSYQVLNEVLRRQSARLTQERDLATTDRLDWERRVSELYVELELQAQELARARNQEGLKAQNEELFKELNEARVREEQTKLINETLVRIHAKESAQLEEFEKECSGLKEAIQIKSGEIALLEERCGQLFGKDAATNELLLKLEGEKEFFKDRLEKLMPELEIKETRLAMLQEQFVHLQARLSETAGTEGLHKQLRAQFQQKDEQLQLARAERFKAETEAQTLQRRVEELEHAPEPFSTDLRKELERAEAECRHLSEENAVLEEIVTGLSHVKKKDLSPDVASS